MASAKLSRTTTAPTSADIGTMSFWLKRTAIDQNNHYIISNYTDGSNYGYIRFKSGDQLQAYGTQSNDEKRTNRVFRDTSAWYHIVLRVDTTQGTAADRVRLYVNGVQETSFSTSTNVSQNTDYDLFKSGGTMIIGHIQSGTATYLDGQLAHFHYADGQSYAPTVFGETDATTGTWKPKTNPGISQANYGNNGFFLKFDNSANMGLDSSGNSHNLTTSGTILQYKDPQLNVNDKYAAAITNAGRTITNENNNATGVMSTLAVDTGKWYWEAKVKDTASDTFNVGMRKTGLNNYNVTGWSYGTGAFVYAVNGYIYKDGSQSTNTGTTAAVGDIIGFIVDLDAGTVKLQKNGADMYSGNAAVTGLNTGDFWHVVQGASQAAVDFNFGDGYFGTTAITSAGSNGNGLLFEYDVPSGHYGISTKNIASNS